MYLRRVVFLIIVSVLALGALAACGDSDDSPAPPSQPAAPTQTEPPPPPPVPQATPTSSEIEPSDSEVNLDIANFTHVDQTVSAGTTVVWRNVDPAPHTTTSGEPGVQSDTWDSGPLQSGGTFSFTFEQAGSFSYFCSIHPSMRATITVTGETAASPPTQAPPPPSPTTAPSPPVAPAPTATSAPEPPSGPVANLAIANFNHASESIPVGTTIVWRNADSVPHTTTSGEPGNSTGLWDSRRLNQGGTFSFTFSEAGSFSYFCSIHPSMRATITVEDGASEELTSTSSPAPAPTATSVPPTPTAVPATATPVPPTATPEAGAAPATRSVDTVQFRHRNLTVEVGTEVTWANRDGAPHTVTSGLPGSMTAIFRSGTMSEGATFTFTFDQAGSFQYFCEIHPSMQATVTVTENEGAALISTSSDDEEASY